MPLQVSDGVGDRLGCAIVPPPRYVLTVGNYDYTREDLVSFAQHATPARAFAGEHAVTPVSCRFRPQVYFAVGVPQTVPLNDYSVPYVYCIPAFSVAK